MSLNNRLKEYSKSNMYPFHMPGHKRMLEGIYKIDMTEVEGVDDLHDPTEIIAEEQKRMARIFGSDKSYILVGGSTVGNLASIYATCNENDEILIQRNSHKSVYNGAMLRHLRVGYLEPEVDDRGIFKAVSVDMLAQALENNKNIKAVVLTTPSYEGFHCKVKEIAKICHEHNSILIVDQAHGAHLGFADQFTNSAVEHADITIQSLHKTLPSLTQTAALHVSGDRVNLNKIREALDIFETSSPSYVLMNSISECLDFLETDGDSFGKYVDNLCEFYSACGELKHLEILNEDSKIKDPGKIVISTKNTNITGVELARILRENYEIETELSSFAYVLAMTSVMDTEEGFKRLENALKEIDEKLENGNISVPNLTLKYKKKMECFEAKSGEENNILIDESKNKITAAMICLYPPGAPLLVPGEVITEEVLEIIKKAKSCGIHVTGMEGDTISVVN